MNTSPSYIKNVVVTIVVVVVIVNGNKIINT